MAKSIANLTVEAPGFRGLNTQRRGSVLPPGWATRLTNAVFDDEGRLASRKGHKALNGTVIPNSPSVKAAFDWVDSSGNRARIIAADNKIFSESGGTITDVSGTITTPTGDYWQFVNFNDWVVGFQEGHAPIVATDATSIAFANSGGTQYNGSMVLSAYGRLWTVYQNTLYYSDLLVNNFTGGSSGNFDLASYWPSGMDEAVAMADFNGYLIVFGKDSTIIYENPDDVTNMTIRESINGVGCIARDSVQTVGDDIIFLSNTGLRSLRRTVQQQGAMPMSDISANVRDNMLSLTAQEQNNDAIKSVFNERDGFYLLSFPTSNVSYYFDLKSANEDGTLKAATWSIAPTAMMYSYENILYIGVTTGYFSTYVNYVDGANSAGANGSSYTFDYEGPWIDFSNVDPALSNYVKIPKKVSVLGSGAVTSSAYFKWAVDYSDSFSTRPLAFSSLPAALFGVGRFGIATFASVGSFDRVNAQLGRTGQVMKIGVSVTIEENAFALQRIDILAKIGRIGF